MRRLTSVSATMLPVAALIGLLCAGPASAQSTRQPNLPSPSAPMAPMAPPGLVEPTFQPMAVAPTPLPAGHGQQSVQTTPPAAAPRAEPRAPYLGGPTNQAMPSHTNIKLDMTITDTFTGTPVKKTVTLLMLTGNSGMIRTTSADGWATLNVDAVAAAYSSGLVSLRLTFEYTPPMPKDTTMGNRPPRLNESITVVLQDGKPMVVSQSADPATDRKVTAELTATILK